MALHGGHDEGRGAREAGELPLVAATPLEAPQGHVQARFPAFLTAALQGILYSIYAYIVYTYILLISILNIIYCIIIYHYTNKR